MLGDKPGTCAGLISGVPAGTERANPQRAQRVEDKCFEGVVRHEKYIFPLSKVYPEPG